MNQKSTNNKSLTAGTLLTDVKNALRDFIDNGEKLEFEEVCTLTIKIISGDMCSSKITALQPNRKTQPNLVYRSQAIKIQNRTRNAFI